MLKEFDDDVEAENKTHEYYRDRTAYLRTREIFRSREAAQDEQDQKQEEMELARGQNAARSIADAFLEEQAQELLSRPQQTRNAPIPDDSSPSGEDEGGPRSRTLQPVRGEGYEPTSHSCSRCKDASDWIQIILVEQ